MLPFYESFGQALRGEGAYIAVLFSGLSEDEARAHENAAIQVVKKRTFYLGKLICLMRLSCRRSRRQRAERAAVKQLACDERRGARRVC